MARLWFRNATIYAAQVATYHDGNGDGTGDLAGLREKLDYLRGLGVDCLWLLPFYRSPWRDNGYDVSDYYQVDPRFGDLGDMVEFVQAADDRGIKVLIDLVVEHTSDEHPWFRAARSDRDSPYRDYYIWSDDPERDEPVQPMFPGHQRGTWTRDETTGQFYRHRFYSFEPELNLANPQVRHEIYKVVQFWLRLGVAGFRIDAAPYLTAKAAQEDPTSHGHWFLRKLRDLVREHRADGILLGETDVDREEYGDFFGDGDELHLLFNFYLNNYYFLSLARRAAQPVLDALEQLPAPPATAQYVNWMRNHDELNLSRLTEQERQEVLAAFSPQPESQIFGRGSRRRIAPMLDGDQRRLQMATALLLSLPGAPMIRYGEEIGMGDDLSLPERNSVRTPMQWSAREPNGGFSTAPAEKLVRPLVRGGRYGYEHVNVEAQARDRESLLSTVMQLLRARRESSEIGEAPWRRVETGCPSVVALRYDGAHDTLLVLTNLDDVAVEAQLPAIDDLAYLADVLSDQEYSDQEDSDQEDSDQEDDAPVGDGRTSAVRLGPYGYRWLRGRRHPW